MTQTRPILLILFFFFLCFVSLPSRVLAQCHSSPDLSIMDQDFYRLLSEQTNPKSDGVLILPFYDHEDGYQDEALSFAIPFYLFDVFSPQIKNLIHPYLALQELKKKNVIGAGKTLFDPAKAQEIGTSLKARFVIFGSVQRSFRDTVIVTIYVTDTKTKETLSPAEDFETGMDDSLFNNLATHVASALGSMKNAPKNNLKKFGYTPTLVAFRAYGKASRLSASYNLDQLALASIWFEKALKESYHKYPEAAWGWARAEFMQALVKRLQKQDAALNLQKANQALSFIKRHNQTSLNEFLAWRFQEAYQLAAQATAALMNHNLSLAVTQATKALELVPEDGFMQGILLEAQGQSKGKKTNLSHPVCL